MTRKKKLSPAEEAADMAALQAEIDQLKQQLAQTDTAALREQLEAQRIKADENLAGWQRALADYSNYKRRIERDQASSAQMMTANVVRRYLDVADDLDRALRARPLEGEGASWSNGIELIYRKLLSILEAEGVRPLQAEGAFFDPALHEAISHEESSQHDSGQIIGVVQQGYILGDRVLRPARVRVAR